jgi:SAM-dependent methyltransferase
VRLHGLGPSHAWNRATWSRYAWPQDGDEWSASFGSTEALWAVILKPRLADALPCRHVLEVGPGHGRCTALLRCACDNLTAVDVTPECVDACRRRFAGDPAMAFHVNDGRSLVCVAEDSVDLVFSWDSLVHADPETVDAYVAQIGQKLRPGGVAWLHHSNAGELDRAGRRRAARHARHPRGSARRVRAACALAGLACSQELVPWSGPQCWSDVFTRIERGGGGTKVVLLHDWEAEIAACQRRAQVETSAVVAASNSKPTAFRTRRR